MWASGTSRYSKRGLVALSVSLGLFSGCGGGTDRKAREPGATERLTCRVDEVREYFCDELVPPNPTLPAAPPYEACPSSVEGPVSQFASAPAAASFDPSYTSHTRRRAPPGHACCYSWCSRVEVTDPSLPSIQAACSTGKAFREEYCMTELESGSSLPGPSPFERCPVALRPPAKAVFSVPESAVLDMALSASRRGRGDPQCCYSWCSQAPLGSNLVGR